MATVQLSKLAEKDLEEIWVFTFKTWSETQANNYIEEFDEAFHVILNNPKVGKSISFIRQGYRQYPVKKHIIYYKLSDQGDIHISRILHQSMNHSSHMSAE